MVNRHNGIGLPGIGVVKNWIQDRGFGFIDMQGRNVFVHMTQIEDGREELEAGEAVYFELREDEKGRLSAKNVSTNMEDLHQHIQYVQGPTGHIFAVPVNPIEQQILTQQAIQQANEMIMMQNQAMVQNSPQLKAAQGMLNSVVSEMPTLAPEIPGLNPNQKPEEVKPTAHPLCHQQENRDPITQTRMLQEQQILQAQHLQQLQMFHLQQQQLVQSQRRVVLFPMCLAAQNVMLNQPALPGFTPNVPATKKTNQKTKNRPQAGATHSFYKTFAPY